MNAMSYQSTPAKPPELHLAVYGVHIALRVTEAAWLDVARPYLPPAWEPAPDTPPERTYSVRRTESGDQPPTYILDADDDEVTTADDLDDLFTTFENHSRHFIAEMAPQHVFLHAGVVGWRGQAIIIPGRSYSGKTSLVASLVQHGALYLSDEYAVLDSTGWVHPYARQLSIRDTETGAQREVGVETLGGVAATAPLPVGLVLVSQYEDGATWTPTRLSPSDGMLALADNAVAIRRSPERVLGAIRHALAEATILKGTRGEAHTVVAYLNAYYV